MLKAIVPMVLTFNEESNLARCLDSLAWATRVLVVDSGSSDSTLDIARSYSNVEIVVRAFDHHAQQWNFALDAVGGAADWVMALDADYVVTAELKDEISQLQPAATVSGFRIGFDYFELGTKLRKSLYPPLIVLFRTTRGRYLQHGHRMVLDLDGKCGDLRSRLRHDDRKSMDRWIASQRKYARLEADRLEQLGWFECRWRDRLRKMIVIAPWAVPAFCFVALGLWRDGRAGWQYVKGRAIAEYLISRELMRG